MKSRVDKAKEGEKKSVNVSATRGTETSGSAFQFADKKGSTTTQMRLQEKANASRQVASLRKSHLVANRQTHNQAATPVQRVVKITGGGEEFGSIVNRFFLFAKAQGGLALQMIDWFHSGPHNTLELVSTAELGSKGYTDCQIGGKPAHTLTNEEWNGLKPDTPAKVIVSIKRTTDKLDKNDAKQFYVILHELMVHTYPFYEKIKNVREGKGPKSKAEAGYHEGPDAMGAHAEHQALLNKTNPAFYELYRFMHGKMLAELLLNVAPEFKGLNPGTFSDEHEHDIMVQYLEKAGLKAKIAQAQIDHVFKNLEQLKGQNKTKEEQLEAYKTAKTTLEKTQVLIREVWTEYHQAYTLHSKEHIPAKKESKEESKSDDTGTKKIPKALADQLPAFNPNAWNTRTMDALSTKIHSIAAADEKVKRFIKQLEAAISAKSK